MKAEPIAELHADLVGREVAVTCGALRGFLQVRALFPLRRPTLVFTHAAPVGSVHCGVFSALWTSTHAGSSGDDVALRAVRVRAQL